MRELSRFTALLLCAYGMAHPSRASAQNAPPLELTWNALEGCPTSESVLARVRQIAGPTRTMPSTLRADASVTPSSDGRFRLRLEIHYGNLAAVRKITGKSCKDLAGATAVALALLLSSEEPLSERDLAGPLPATEPGTTESEPDLEPSAPKNQPPAPTPAPPPTPPAPPTPVESGVSRRWHALLLAPLGAISVGPMRQVSVGLGLGAGFSFDRWRFLAESKFWASQHETVSHADAEFDVEVKRFTLGARACRVVFGTRFELAPCALVSVHHLSARGSGQNFVPATGTATWAAVGLGVRTRLLFAPWLGLVAGIDGELQLSRPEIGVSPPPVSQVPTSDRVERLAPLAATLTAGMEWIF